MNKGMRGISIRTVLLIGGIIGAILPAAILGVVSAYALRSQIVQHAMDNNRATAHTIAEDLNEYLDQRARVVTTVAGMLSRLDRIDQVTAYPTAETVSQNFPVLTAFAITDPKGIRLAVYPEQFAGKALGQLIPRHDLVARALREHRTIIDPNVTPGSRRKALVVNIAAPIYYPNGAYKGAVLGILQASRLQQYVDRESRQDSGFIEVAGANGRVVADADAAVVARQASFTGRPIWNLVNKTDAGTIDSYTDESGHERFGAYATVPGVGWKVWSTQPITYINEQIAQIYRVGLVWCAIAVLLAVGLKVLLTGVIVRPIDALCATADDIAAGDLEQRAPETGFAELATLGRAFNNMSAELQKSNTAERMVKERLERSVREYGDFAAHVAAGDLGTRVVVEDPESELGHLGTSLNAMAASIEELVNEIRGAASSLASATNEILAATTQQVSSAAEGAAAVRQTAATVREVRQTAEISSRKTRLVAELAQRVEQTAQNGRRSVEESVRTTEGAKDRMETLAERILAFSEQAQAIAEINATVADLAEQSNLLAVNAGIEAAKAGDASKGFSVVASEIKELGARSKDATTQVRRIVTDIQKSAQAAVMAAEQGVKAADTGTLVVQRSGEAMETLAESISQASEAAQQIIASAEQQEAGMDQIALAMHNIEQASTQTVTATQQVERAATDLNGLAQKLTDLIHTGTRSRVEGARV